MNRSTAGRKAATLADVAALAGVSQQTVSRVVTGQGRVATRTMARVQEAIGQLNYVPNRLAQALARQRTQSIGFATNDIALHAPSQLASGIERAARERGYSVIVSIVYDYGLAPVTQAVRALKERQVDGLLINASLSREDAAELQERFHDIPCVFLDVPHDAPVHAALLDQYHGARLAAEHLTALGHTRVAFIREPGSAVAEHSRLQGWRDVLAEHGLEAVAQQEGDWSAASGYTAALRLLASGIAFSGLLVANDQMAVGALRALWERGLRVPGDVSVIGYDDTAESALLIPPLTTVRQDFPTLGRRAFYHLLELLDGETLPPRVTLTRPDLTVRTSTAAPRQKNSNRLQEALRVLNEEWWAAAEG
ncbi:LacI family DNA-binding transcriptional regulator (plasmid) [Deinococcus sp. KNUC1210]|uniref:LacI family DNA-binding transcriptional regulator n=1 Tax=Deinococcus sp. KNUC1210 TaxID=2917691 RepID=UPI001EF07DC4|nr:LacI family DNA-binding transcriptional regulator [Deinococcus sp. KNUC1210]ULH17017.1 LacI family DNA-binding transcriptional regulator [Deinococcus sp. KNUC1210]